MTIFYTNLRKIAEMIRNFLAKIVKICPKNVYCTLNRYAGNMSAAPEAGARSP